jgi:hypothetical protein
MNKINDNRFNTTDENNLASVLDLSSKQVVGWALSKQPNAQLARGAIQI